VNDRIKQLVKQAGLNVDGYGYPIWGSLDGEDAKKLFLEKFAALIVKECAKIADDGCGSACFGLGINGVMLEEHFGIKNERRTAARS
jgi:hypothetical protein